MRLPTGACTHARRSRHRVRESPSTCCSRLREYQGAGRPNLVGGATCDHAVTITWSIGAAAGDAQRSQVGTIEPEDIESHVTPLRGPRSRS